MIFFVRQDEQDLLDGKKESSQELIFVELSPSSLSTFFLIILSILFILSKFSRFQSLVKNA